MEINEYIEYLVKWLQNAVHKAHAQGVVVGLSGGIDSAVVGALAQKAFPDHHLMVLMPCHSQEMDLHCAQLLVKQLQLTATTFDLSDSYDCIVQKLHKDKLFNAENKLTLANIKPRLRMTTLYAYAQSHNYLVLGTDNADEWHIGYFTKYGDGGVDLLPIVHLLKKEVRAMASALSVPEVIITRQPTAGLWEGQTDEQELGFSYQELDDYLLGKPIRPLAQSKIERLHDLSQHKRGKAQRPDQWLSKLIDL